jgi:small subunit ribosomal protein S9
MAGKQKVISKIHAVGRRKTAVARVYLSEGSGKIEVNGKELQQYFGETTVYGSVAIQPLTLIDVKNNFDVRIVVKGGGLTGQSDAISLALSRALCMHELKLAPVTSTAESEEGEGDSDVDLRPWKAALKSAKLLTRDSRAVERKKYGFRKARKKEQYSKR